MNTNLKVGCYQFGPKLLDPGTNLSEIARASMDLSVDLAVYPELAASGYFFSSADEVKAVAEPIPGGPSTRAAERIAASVNCHVVIGVAEVEDESFFNSAVLVGPDGYIGRYRKTHLFYEEKRWFSPGDTGFPVFELTTATGMSYRLGMMICFDWFFPESVRTLAGHGADVIAHPSNLVKEWCPHAMPIRALENHVYTATADRVGSESNGREELFFIGSSLICGPDGAIKASAGRTTTEWIFATCDLEEARNKQVTNRNEIFADRRPENYIR